MKYTLSLMTLAAIFAVKSQAQQGPNFEELLKEQRAKLSAYIAAIPELRAQEVAREAEQKAAADAEALKRAAEEAKACAEGYSAGYLRGAQNPDATKRWSLLHLTVGDAEWVKTPYGRCFRQGTFDGNADAKFAQEQSK